MVASVVGWTSVTGNATSINLTIPAAAAVGDVAWLGIAAQDTNPGSAPGGWTLEETVTTGNLTTRRYSKVLTSGEPGSTIAVTAPVANKMTIICVVATGVDAAVIESINTPAGIGVNLTDTIRTNPSATLTISQLVLSFVFGRGNTTLTDWAAPSGWTRVTQAFNTGSGETSGAVAHRTIGPGGVGGDNWASNVADLRGVTMLVVVEGVASGTPAPPSGVLYAGVEHTIWTISGPLALAQAGALA